MAASNLQEIDSSESIIEICLRSRDRKNHYFPRFSSFEIWIVKKKKEEKKQILKSILAIQA